MTEHDNRYADGLAKHGLTSKALLWTSDESVAQRYRNLVADIDFEGLSVLDVGCGFGDVIPHISAKADSFTYSGIDLMPEFIEEAKRRHPNMHFEVGDYFAKPTEEIFDVVLCCGALNSNMPEIHELRRTALAVMYAHARKAVAFSMVGGFDIPTSAGGTVQYADIQEIMAYCATLSPKLIVRHHYNLKDFTIILFK